MVDQEKIHNQCLSDYPNERIKALKQLESDFTLIPNKPKAWDDLHKLTNDKDCEVRFEAVEFLGSTFPKLPNKQQAWDDLVKLTNDEDSNVSSRATIILDDVFSHVPDKQLAWDDLVKLTKDKDGYKTYRAADALGSAFLEVPDKQLAWDDLVKLTNNQYNSYVSYRAASALGHAFSHVPDKQRAWNDLHKLTKDEDGWLRANAASALGSAFLEVPDKQQALEDLHRLINDEHSDVIAYANHSLGKVSIFKASQSEKEEDYKEELETAIVFFEKSAQMGGNNNPAQFCLPFYRSFHTIIFKRQKAKEEVDKYLEEAKATIEGSESKELLFEAVENLAKALEEVQNWGNLDLDVMKGELSYYRKYFDKAAELMNYTNDTAPYTTKVLIKGLPFLDKKLKTLIEEIKEKARTACQVLKGTTTEEIACAVSKEVQKLEISNQEEMAQKVEDVAYLLKKKVAYLPENEYVLSKIEAMKHEINLVKQYETLLFVISLIPTMKVIPKQELDDKLLELGEDIASKIVDARDEIKGEIVNAKEEIINEIVNIKDKLRCISFNTSNIGLNSYNIISNLNAIKADLENLKRISNSNMSSLETSNSNLTEQLNDLNNILQDRWNELENLIDGLAKDDDTQKILSIVKELKQSKLSDLIQTPLNIATLIGFLIQLMQVCKLI